MASGSSELSRSFVFLSNVSFALKAGLCFPGIEQQSVA